MCKEECRRLPPTNRIDRSYDPGGRTAGSDGDVERCQIKNL